MTAYSLVFVLATVLGATRYCQALEQNGSLSQSLELQRHAAAEAAMASELRATQAACAGRMLECTARAEVQARTEAEALLTGQELASAQQDNIVLTSKLMTAERDERRLRRQLIASQEVVASLRSGNSDLSAQVVVQTGLTATATAAGDRARESAAVAAWNLAVANAVSGECGGVGGFLWPGAFDECARQTRAVLSKYREDGIQCSLDGASSPVYRPGDAAGGLRRGALLLCDRALPEAK